MRTRLTRAGARTVTAVAVIAGAALGTAGLADAAPADGSHTIPSACVPANQTGVITEDHPSAGHRHYRVTLTAKPGAGAECILQGSPTGLVFSLNGSPRAVEATPYGDQSRPVELADGHPVAFDIQVPNTPGGALANTVTFGLPAPGGGYPGPFSAQGPIEIDAGTQVGPVHAI